MLFRSVGDQIELDRVLMLSDGESVQIGQPVVKGAKVTATILDHAKGDKVTVFKFRPKQRYKRTIGHRQLYTRLRIDQIEA